MWKCPVRKYKQNTDEELTVNSCSQVPKSMTGPTYEPLLIIIICYYDSEDTSRLDVTGFERLSYPEDMGIM